MEHEMNMTRIFGSVGLALAFFAAVARGDAGQDAWLEEQGSVGQATAEEWAEATSPMHGGGNWMTYLEHRGEGDGWEGDVDLRDARGRRVKAKALPRSASTMGKVVYGWLPYWATSAQMDQFQWDKLTHVAYFSYEVNSANGGCSGKHSWGSSIVQKAHNHNVKIHLTATLFGSTGNKALLQSETSCNTLVANLVSEVTGAGGDGICIDFESVGSWTGATKALTAFMTKLANAASAKGLEVSIALPSIDWYTDFDVASFEKLGIMCIIMGYDYHYSGSSVPGPVAPLMPSSRWGAQLNDDYSVRYYLGKMTNASHLYLAVPYYGRKWKASSTAMGASNLGSSYSSSPVLSTCASSAASYGRKWDGDGSVPWFSYTDSAGAAWQCFYDDVESLGLKYDYINSKGLGGVGIWALSHEPGTAKFWNLLYQKFGPGTGGGGSSGGGTVEDGSASVTWNFSGAEGWTQQSSNFTGTTNVAGEVWTLNAARVYPAASYAAATGDLWLDVPDSSAVTPAIKGVVVTQVTLTVRAAANSNLSGRKVGVYYSVNGGSSWTKAGTVNATAYDSLTPSSVSVPGAGGGADGIKFKLLDESTTQETGTVLIYQMVVKGRDATTGTLKVTLTPGSATWSLNGTTYASGDTITLAAGTYTVTFNALAGYDTPAAKSVTLVAGGTQEVKATYTESSNWTRTIEFASSDGWSMKTNAFFAGTTNVAGEAWVARGLKVNPTVNSQNNVGYALLDGTGDYLVTPVITGTITQMVGMIRAGANSNLENRKLDVQYSTDGGSSWTTSATWAANNYSASVTHTKSCNIGASGGVKLRFYDSGTTDTNKTTVVLHQIVLKGTKTVAAPDTGTVTCTLTPSNAKWKINGTNYASGATVTVPVGTYTVSFNSLGGYIAPADKSVSVTKNGAKTISATYTEQPGALTVTLEPAAAADGATWKVSGSSATHASGETVSLSPGTYTVSFNALAGYTKPADQTVTVSRGAATSATGTYTWNPGTLTVSLQPAAVQGAGRWFVNGQEHSHGESVTLGAGTYTVSFGAVGGYDTPADQSVAVTAGGSKTATGTYTEHGAVSKGYDFTLAEGWTERASLVPSLTTNAAGGTWNMEGVKIFPTYATNNETGYVVIEQVGNWVQLPTFQGCVTQVSAKVRAGADSVLDTRKLTLQYDVGGGWVDWGTWACSNYSNVLSKSKNATVSGGSAGVKLRVLDTSTGGASKSTVVLHAITVKGNSDAGAASTGTLTVTLVPDTATWKVGGTTYASGATATLVAGNYAVSFNAASGYDTPASTNVTVAAGAAKTLKATYAAHPGTVTATLSPADVRGSAQWKINGTNYASGATATVPAGSYSVTYTLVTGYTTPASQTVVVPAGGSATADATYEVKPASLKVTLDPPGGTWKVAGTNFESGATAKLAPGTYTVSFNPQTGYATPEPQSVTLSPAQNKTMTVAYPGLEGSVRYVLSPAAAVSAGATWKINGTNYASGDTAVVPSGTYAVTFGAVAGYAAPSGETLTVDAEETLERTAVYTEKPGYLTVKLAPTNDADLQAAGRWFVGGTPHAGGEKVALAPGSHTVTFGAVAGRVTPGPLEVAIESEHSQTHTVAYVGLPGYVSFALTPDTGSWKINGETYASGAVAEVPAGTYAVTFGALTGYTAPASQSVEVAAGQTLNGTAAYSPKPGFLTVKLAPTNATTGVRWTVAGTSHASGEKVSLPPGTYEVTFGALAEYATPEPLSVTVESERSQTKTVQYVGLPGDVTYTLSPPEGTWKINGETYGSDDVASVPAGEYKVTFGAVKGYTAPDAQTIEVAVDGFYEGSATYTVKQVPLTVKLNPAEVQASATWSVAGVAGTHAHAEAVPLDPGDYTVTCGSVAGWVAPAATNVTLNLGASSKTVTLTYKEAPGTLRVALSPSSGRWNVAGTNYASGATATLAAGTYTVTFDAVEGWVTPEAQEVVLAAGAERNLDVAYGQVGVPQLGNASGVATNGFGISWSGVSGATRYVVQIAASPDFDEEVLLESFAAGAPEGWTTNKVTFAANKTSYSGDGTGVAVFAGKGHWLTTPKLSRPGKISWWHATTSNAAEWQYEVEFCTDTNFADLEWTETFTVTDTAAGVTPAKQSMDVSGLRDVYVQWRDTRETGTAQRYISAVSVREALAAEKTTTGTGASFTGLESGTTYYVRVRAETAEGEGAWSGVKTVATAEAPATLTVTLTPAGGTWTVGGVTHANGETATLAAGTYRVTFAAPSGYVSPAAQNVTLASGETKELTVPCEPEPVGVPVLGTGSGITTGAFNIAWSGVSGATHYTVEVAESATFDEGVAVSASFEDGALPAGWAANKVAFTNNKTAFSGDGKGVAIFAGSNHWLRTPKLSHPGLLGWSHAKNTGSAAGTAWSYVLECSETEDFTTVVTNISFEVDDAVTSPVDELVDLGGLRDVYVRWRDTRASGTAQRYLSEIIAWDGLAASAVTAATSATFAGLEASRTYYVRVKASTATGVGDWSAIQTVRTADPPSPPAAPVLENAGNITASGFSIAWNAVDNAEVYHLQVSDVATFDDEPILVGDFSGDLPAGWETTAALTNATTYALDGGSAVVFKGANKFLRTPMVANPATLTWYHGTTGADEWRYELQASYSPDFSAPILIRSVTVTQKLATAVQMTANLRGKKNVYLRWVDTRPSGAAQRFISGISLTCLPVVNDNGLAGTSRNVSGLNAGTAYCVRVRAIGPGGTGPWSAVKTVRTASSSGEIDPDNPPYNPALVQPQSGTWEVRANLDGTAVSLDWNAVAGAVGYNVEACTNLQEGVWFRVDTQYGGTNSSPPAIPGDGPVFYRLRAW